MAGSEGGPLQARELRGLDLGMFVGDHRHEVRTRDPDDDVRVFETRHILPCPPGHLSAAGDAAMPYAQVRNLGRARIVVR